MDLQLGGLRAIVTGSTGGIGLAAARVLAAEGAQVIICGRDQAKLDDAARSVSEIGQVLAVKANPATAEGAAALIAAVPEADILINNLGIYEPKPFTELKDADWQTMFDVNVMSGVRLARHYLPVMVRAGWGRIIFVSSNSALLVPPDMVHYAATKAAQLALARGLAEQTRGTAVTVNSVLAGPTRSSGIDQFLRSTFADEDLSPEQREARFMAQKRPLSLIGRLIRPEEIAAQIAFLASPLSAVVNGSAVRADGGIIPTIA
jgi:NAD(P)-dependent dehydrogenase (short-subunit alcohol dehydrogenase family)